VKRREVRLLAIERMQLPVGKQFDHQNLDHINAAMKVLAEKGHGSGWEIQSFDPAAGVLTVSRRSALTTVTKSESKTDSYRVELMRGIKPSDGDQIAAQLESDPQHAGYYMTRFEPFISEATMSRLNEDERRARAAIATVLNVKPWDVQISKRSGGGFKVGLPNSYVPSKHDEKLDEIAQVAIGKIGWYFRGDANKLVGEIVPSAPATFPAAISYPMDLLPKKQGASVVPPIPVGVTLPRYGDEQGDVLYLDLEASPHTQLAGTSGAGKSVTLNNLIAGALAGGAELVVIDVPAKAVDFDVWRPYVRRGGWGCESFQEGAIALEQLYKEGNERAATLKRYGAKKLSELPPDVQAKMPPVFIVVDEVTGLFSMATVPKGLADDHPLRVEAVSQNLAKELIKQYLEKIAAEQRFVGYKLVVSTQVASTATGISTAFRTNLGNKALLGARATDGNRKLILRDVTSVPDVPDHIKNDSAASRGVGVSEFEGQEAYVFKSFYASESELTAELNRRGIRPHAAGSVDSFIRPDPKLVSSMFPEVLQLVQADREAAQPSYGEGPREFEAWELDPETGKPLDGFARANAARAAVTANAKTER
jgi:hypothetical protein